MMIGLSVTLFGTLLASVTISSALSTETTQIPVDIVISSKQLISLVRNLTTRAKDGTSLTVLKTNMLALQTQASDLLGRFPGSVSECETQAVIKMAAAAVGSHEVLGLLLAKDHMSLLYYRLALALAFLEQVVQQMEVELTLSRDVGPHLAAIVFGTNSTVSVIEESDKAVQQGATTASEAKQGRYRRQSLKLGKGWSVGLGGVNWQSKSGMTTFNVKPTFNGFKPGGFRATLTIRF